MAIHENFDWKILESFENTKAEHPEIKTENSMNNGYDVKAEDEEEEEEEDDCEEQKTQLQSDINFESLIEEVECSSDSENDSEDDDQQGQNEETSTSDPSDTDDVSEENSLESQMLQNMLIEKTLLQKQVEAIKNNNSGSNYKTEPPNKIIPYDSAENGIKQETSSESEDSNSSSTEHENEYKSEMKSENCSSDEEDESQVSVVSEDEEEDDENREDSNDSSRNVFERKPEELDSAIKSISYEEVDVTDEQVSDQFCELQAQNLNPHEIQSAVDSIL